MKKVAVIGAGAAGISAAYRLKQQGIEPTLFEASDVIGGRCRSVRKGKYLFDIGAGIVPSTYKNALNLAEAVGILNEYIPSYTVIGSLRDGEVHHIDSKKPLTFFKAKHLSGKSKRTLVNFAVDLLRMFRAMNFYDLSTAAKYDTETVAEYCERRLNKELLEHFIGPLCRALFLVEPEHSSVVDLFCSSKSVLTATHLAGHPKGIGYFLEVAAQGFDLRHNCPVSLVEENDTSTTVIWKEMGQEKSEQFDACVITLPAPEMMAIYPQLDSVRKAYLEAVEYSRSIVVHLGLTQRTDENASMLLIPREVEPGLPVIGVAHNLSPERAPAGHSNLIAYWMTEWSNDHWNDSDEALTQITVETINRHFPRLADKLDVAEVTRWDRALVAAKPGVYSGMVAFSKHCKPSNRVQLAGDYLAQTSVNSSVASGERAAENLVSLLSG